MILAWNLKGFYLIYTMYDLILYIFAQKVWLIWKYNYYNLIKSTKSIFNKHCNHAKFSIFPIMQLKGALIQQIAPVTFVQKSNNLKILKITERYLHIIDRRLVCTDRHNAPR